MASQVIARAWLTKLDKLELELLDENIGSVSLKLASLPNSDSVNLDDRLRNRKELKALIKDAKKYFQRLLE